MHQLQTFQNAIFRKVRYAAVGIISTGIACHMVPLIAELLVNLVIDHNSHLNVMNMQR